MSAHDVPARGGNRAVPGEDVSVQQFVEQRRRVHRRARRAGRGSGRIAGPIDAFQIMTEADDEKADAALERLLESESVERHILEELMVAQSLADPEGFPATHRTFVRALEIYDRNARRSPTRLPASFLRPLATPVVTALILAIADGCERAGGSRSSPPVRHA